MSKKPVTEDQVDLFSSDPATEEDAMAILSGKDTNEALKDFLAEKDESKKPEEVAEASETSQETPPLYSKVKLLTIFDSLMFSKDGYSEEMEVIKGRLYATFRTRSTDVSNRINLAIDRQKFSSMLTLQNHQVIMTMSYALKEYTVIGSDGKRSTRKVPGEPAKAYEALKTLPEAVIEALSRGLTEFDLMVRMAVAEGETSF
jgi:hypothetical protein